MPNSTIVLRLDPRQLTNPNLDIRYVLPQLITERSGGIVRDNGYDYVGGETTCLVLFLTASDEAAGIVAVLDVVNNVTVMENDLRPAVVVALQRGEKYDVVFPSGLDGSLSI